jgi:hypothetical protein
MDIVVGVTCHRCGRKLSLAHIFLPNTRHYAGGAINRAASKRNRQRAWRVCGSNREGEARPSRAETPRGVAG